MSVGDPQPWRFRPDIEGLRAVAIGGVILFHAGVEGVSGGFLGVDVFFVISGFLITGILVAEGQRTGTIHLGNFWARRIRRLLPAAALVCLGTLILSWFLDSPFAQASNAKSAIAFGTYWSNLLFVHRGADYFDQSLYSDPFLHTWTLGVEEQYYLLFAPLCLLVVLAASRRKDFRPRLLRIVVLGSLVSFVACLWLAQVKPLVAFYTLPTRAWEFGAGALLAISTVADRKSEPWVAATSAVSLGLIVASFLVVDESTRQPGWATAMPVIGTAALIRLGGARAGPVAYVLESNVARFLGRLSYSWYLWHWPVTVYWKLLPFSALPLWLGMPLLSLGLAWLTYVTVETPGRTAQWLQGARRGLITALVLAMVMTGTAVAAMRSARLRLRDPKVAFILGDRNTEARIYGNGCHVALDEVEPKLCVYGSVDGSRSVVLFGDSHAAQWFEVLDRVSAVLGWRLYVMTKSGCPSMSVTVWLTHPGRSYPECDRWRARALSKIDSLAPSVVAISNSNWHHVVGSEAGRTAVLDSGTWKRAITTTLNGLPRASAVLLIEDSPNPLFNVPDCLIRHVNSRSRCDFVRARAIQPGFRTAALAVSRDDPRISYVDFTDVICEATLCRASRGDTALYSDADHLGLRFTTSLAPLVESALLGARVFHP